MFSLSNDHLVVSLLDPVSDEKRLGARYVRGGYIYQVHDRVHGPLLSGPGYPSEFWPPVFDGQGLPEAFSQVLGEDGKFDDRDTESLCLVLGVGTAKGGPRTRVVQEACEWEVKRTVSSVEMVTQHDTLGWRAQVKRTVTLYHRTLRSITSVSNLGSRDLPLRWFPHPFYPPVADGVCCKFSLPVTCPANDGYVLREDGWIARKLDHIWTRAGHFQELGFLPAEPLGILQRHPKLGIVGAQCEYTPCYLPIWGNSNTFSFEPYLERTVAPGGETSWAVSYEF